MSEHDVTYRTGADAPSQPAAPGFAAPIEIGAAMALAAISQFVSHQLGADSPAGNIAAFIGLMLVLGLVLWFHRRRRDGWGAIGLARPKSWPKTILGGLAATVVMMAAALVFQQAVITPLLAGETPDISRFDVLVGNLPLLLLFLASVWLSAGFGEEVIYRGFLMGRLARVFGEGRGAWIGSLFASSVIFGLLHLYQGLAGVLITGFVGLLLGTLYLLVRRNLWVGILAHGLIDTVSLVSVYLGAVPS